VAQNPGCLAFLFGKKEIDDGTLPYKIRDDFLSSSEKSFYKVLDQIFSTRYLILAKVSLSDLFYVTNPDKHMKYWNKINRKHVDFLICDSKTMKPIMGIELDDSSHSKPQRKARDLFVNNVFEVSGLPLARVPARKSYNIDDLKDYLKNVYKSKDNTKTVSEGIAYSNQNDDIAHVINEPSETQEYVDVAPNCPKCDTVLVVRKSKTGERFYGCPNFPRCKHTEVL
jgi:very-short-patch-repair endonuclease